MIWVLALVVVVALLWIRLAPYDPGRWHVVPRTDNGDRDFRNGALRIVDTGPQGLADLDAVAQATPRTEVVSGTVEEGMVTFVTRSRVFGFPDYTTARQNGDLLEIYARSRFGRSDFGVNRNRVTGWLDAIQ